MEKWLAVVVVTIVAGRLSTTMSHFTEISNNRRGTTLDDNEPFC